MRLRTITRIFSPSSTVHTGVARTHTGARFACVVKDRRGGHEIVATGPTNSLLFRLTRPMAAHMDLGFEPVLLVSSPLDGAEAEAWVSEHESTVIPEGFTSQQIVNEYSVEDGEIFSATITKTVLEKATKDLALPGIIPASIAPPLWDLARLYGSILKRDFVLWKIGEDRSVLGFVSGGKLRKLCAFWVGWGDITSSPAECAAQLIPLAKSLAGDDVEIVAYDSDRGTPASMDAMVAAGCRITSPPVIPGVNPKDHEALALALHGDTFVDFVPPEAVSSTRTIFNARRTALRFSAAAFLTALGLILFTALAGGIIHWVQGGLEARARPITAKVALLKEQQHRYDSLLNAFQERGKYLSRESVLTALLSDLQRAFPEGCWLENLSITEAETNGWRTDMSGLCFSTATIPVLLTHLADSAGIKDARMVYSEQSTAVVQGRKDNVIRMKITGTWRSE